MLEEIPLTRPATPLLDQIEGPAQLKQLEIDQLGTLAREIRQFLLYSVGQTGGHLGAGLGVVELTIALHYVFTTPEDRLVWDVGHQAYPHKILTGRRERMLTMRQNGGLAAFPHREESIFDSFGVGHSSTSISAALGMMVAGAHQNPERHTIAVIGDGAMTAGMAFEALNHAGHLNDNILVILNDNNMSISRNVGGLSSYFARMWASKPYNFIRAGGKKMLSILPPALKAANRAEEYMKGMISPGTLFEEIGFNYIGLVDGHNTAELIDILSNVKSLRGPRLLHVVTQKGKGYIASENDPFGMHAMNKVEPARSRPPVSKKDNPTYSAVFGNWLCDMAAQDPLLRAITPAMGAGSGMNGFAEAFPERFFDVGIAEQHAVTFAAGMACDGLKPVVAIYSTFLQRAYDQLIHDVALQNLDVLFAIDRAGLVGEDGPTHAGSFDLGFLRCIPNLLIMTPSDGDETRLLLSTAYQHKGPTAVRYPRGKVPAGMSQTTLDTVEVGRAVSRRKGHTVVMLAFGSMVKPALEAAAVIDATVIDMRFVKPLDEALIGDMVTRHQLLVTLEENAVAGGAGSAVNEFLLAENYQIPTLNLGLPDRFLPHGAVPQMLSDVGLDQNGILTAIRNKLQQCKIRGKAS
ncbi:MAG: 1-deoxy-D-xylulose-5-phosphate synthase [Pseudomonadales bacterium]|nr:1-deoxy-D-xylulose-5-phosphate synthase [Pseudomonadales bacterium]